MSDAVSEVVKTVAWVVVFLAAIQGGVLYLTVRLLTTGHGIFERREHEGKPLIHRMGGDR